MEFVSSLDKTWNIVETYRKMFICDYQIGIVGYWYTSQIIASFIFNIRRIKETHTNTIRSPLFIGSWLKWIAPSSIMIPLLIYIYIENCFCVNLDTDDDIEGMIDVSLYSIIISAPHYYIKSEEFETYLQFNEINYELQVNLHTWSNRHKIWDRDIYSRHVGQFIGWWYQSRKVNVWGHSQSIDLLKENVRYNLGYLEVTSSEVLKYMGGQIHIFCDIHRMPLIVSTDRKLKWNCGSKE